MLSELIRYYNLGNFEYYYTLFNLFHDRPNVKWDKQEIDDYFRGKTIGNNRIFDGALHLMVFAGIIRCNSQGIYTPIDKFQNHMKKNEFEESFLDNLFKNLIKDRSTYDFFSQKYCNFDLTHKTIQIKKVAFALNYAQIREVLISLNFLEPHPYFPQRSFLVNRKYKKLFEKYFSNKFRKQLTQEELDQRLEKQKENGIIGEKFVLEYEKQRTQKHDEIQWISPFNTSAGYDILSFDDKSSQEHDRLIEVKTYSGNKPSFYWSRNEIKIAKDKKNQYFLYLVNINQIEENSYHPKIIKNPACEIFQEKDWKITTENYRIDQKDLN